MNISFDENGQVAVTFQAEEGVKPGCAVAVTGDSQVGVCPAGEKPCGVALSAEEGAAAVQVRGFATVTWSGTAPKPGWAKLTGDGKGGVTLAAQEPEEAGDGGETSAAAPEGREALVIRVDETEMTAVILL